MSHPQRCFGCSDGVATADMQFLNCPRCTMSAYEKLEWEQLLDVEDYLTDGPCEHHSADEPCVKSNAGCEARLITTMHAEIVRLRKGRR